MFHLHGPAGRGTTSLVLTLQEQRQGGNNLEIAARPPLAAVA
jgi:hypothetical protein